MAAGSARCCGRQMSQAAAVVLEPQPKTSQGLGRRACIDDYRYGHMGWCGSAQCWSVVLFTLGANAHPFRVRPHTHAQTHAARAHAINRVYYFEVYTMLSAHTV
jgi:hypothetical protein